MNSMAGWFRGLIWNWRKVSHRIHTNIGLKERSCGLNVLPRGVHVDYGVIMTWNQWNVESV